MAPEEIGPRLNTLIDQSDILNGSFSVEAGLMLAAAMVKDPKLGKTLAWFSLGYSAGSRFWQQYKKHKKAQNRDYVLKIDVNDPTFEVISRWVLQETPEEEQYIVEVQRVYRAKSGSAFDENDLLPLLDEVFGVGTSATARAGSTGEFQNLALEVDDDRPMSLTIDGYDFVISFILPGQQLNGNDAWDGTGDPPSAADRYRGEPHFLITCPSLKARTAFLEKLDASFQSDEKRMPSVFRATSYGDMKRVGDVPPRKLDTVILKPGQIEAIIDDIALFLRSEHKYIELDIPYHHGLLLYGPPGTGKTSIAAAVATSLNLDVYAVSLSNIPDDATLEEVFQAVKPRSVLLLEDIDTCAGARGGTGDDHKGVTVQGLLQTLDGFAAPHGLITVMTTNNPETLDERVVREGRIDTKIEIDCVDSDQVRRLCERFLGYVPEGLPDLVPNDLISPAQVVGVFKTFLYDKEGAGPALVKRINELLAQKGDQPVLRAATLKRMTKPALQKLANDSGLQFAAQATKPEIIAGILEK